MTDQAIDRSISGHTPIRCLIYTRIARPDPGRPDSLGMQEQRCRAWAGDRGWEVAGVHADAHVGTDLAGRPGLTALRAAARAGDADVVLVHSLDRLSRSFAHYETLRDEWAGLGVMIEVVAKDRSEA